MTAHQVHLGVDYGSRKLALAALPASSEVGRAPEVFSHVWKQSLSVEDALVQHREMVLGWVQTLRLTGAQPASAVVERPWVGRNADTAVKLGMVCGAVWTAVRTVVPSALMVPPHMWKKNVVGFGNASKDDTMAFLAEEYPQWSGMWSGDDEADALCMAMMARDGAEELMLL